ncbi:MAG: hypothetical protein WC213_06705 [Arenimonas sp.]|jgi:hypothetical protein
MASLALERAPAAALPLCFLRLAPAWGLLAALLLWRYGATVFASRWALPTVALVHVFTLGVLGNAILGSLLQFLPVVADVQPRMARRLGALVPVSYNLGLAGMVCGLLRWPAWLAPSGLLLASTLAFYSVSALAGLRFDGRQTVLRAGLALALLALLIAAVLGLVLAAALSGLISVPMAALADSHAAIGLLGGGLVLAGSVGSVVLPMFQGTAALPKHWLALWLAGLLCALVAGVALRLANVLDSMALLLAAPVAAFALAVLVLQARAPHRRNGTLVGFWRLGALALLAATMFSLFAARWPESRSAMVAGVLGIAVALPALVLGMLLEIAAFLGWLGLQGSRVRGHRLPSADALFPESRKARVLVLHVASAFALPVAAAWPGKLSVSLAALVLAAAYALTAFELLVLWQRTRRAARGMSIPDLPLAGGQSGAS